MSEKKQYLALDMNHAFSMIERLFPNEEGSFHLKLLKQILDQVIHQTYFDLPEAEEWIVRDLNQLIISLERRMDDILVRDFDYAADYILQHRGGECFILLTYHQKTPDS